MPVAKNAAKAVGQPADGYPRPSSARRLERARARRTPRLTRRPVQVPGDPRTRSGRFGGRVGPSYAMQTSDFRRRRSVARLHSARPSRNALLEASPPPSQTNVRFGRLAWRVAPVAISIKRRYSPCRVPVDGSRRDILCGEVVHLTQNRRRRRHTTSNMGRRKPLMMCQGSAAANVQVCAPQK